MQADDPPYLSVGTAVSAKYKGAFCEAKVSKVVHIVKCKVTYKMGLGTDTISDEQIKGTLRVGQIVQAKHPGRKEFIDATITKIQDCSQYTVVFDDGDITTLRRTALCLKSGRHFNESETLDQLPLTHPEHFGNPVVGGRRGRRNRQLKEDSSEGELEEENEPDLEGYTADIGRVVSVEATDNKKRGKDNWFPGLVVIPSAQPTVRINVKDEYLVRSFKDGRYYTVPKKEVSDFNREIGEKVDSSVLAEAVNKALKYLDSNELPVHWEKSSLFNLQTTDTDSDDNYSDSSDDEPCEEKDRFVAQLYKFMDDAGTPLNKSPTIGSRDVDLYRLFSIVNKLGGYNKVTNHNKWRSITIRLRFANNQNTTNQVKQVYKKCLFSYESFHRTLGVTMLNHTRSTKKNKGRSLIRDRDRATPVNNSPRPDKDEEPPSAVVEKKDEEKEKVVAPPREEEKQEKPKRRAVEVKREEETRKKKEAPPVQTVDSESDDDNAPAAAVVVVVPEPAAASVASTSKDIQRPKRTEARLSKDKKPMAVVKSAGDKVKALVEKFEEQTKKEEEKVQLTRSKAQIFKLKEVATVAEKKVETKQQQPPPPPVAVKETPSPGPSRPVLPIKSARRLEKIEEERKRGKKRALGEDKVSGDGNLAAQNINIGDKLKVFYGPTNESKVTYEAKVVEIEKEGTGLIYLVHYTGWNTRYDEWIGPARVAENQSATTKAKRLKQSAGGGGSNSQKQATGGPPPATKTTVATGVKRGRGASLTGRSTTNNDQLPRSTTPSSTTSTSSRTKSPGTPATRSTSRITRQDSTRRTRRTSAQTDVSIPSETESADSESEPELTRTRSGTKSEEPEIRTYRRRVPPRILIPSKNIKAKEKDEDTEKEEEPIPVERPKRTRKIKKSPEKSGDESDEDGINLPKGRDFDLNQIRSELKGFNKTVPVPAVGAADKEGATSSSSSEEESIAEEVTDDKEKVEVEVVEEPKEKQSEKYSSSEDIYEFKEPEPFEFEVRSSAAAEDKNAKKRLPRFYEDLDKSPKSKNAAVAVVKTPEKIEVKEKEPVGPPEIEKRFLRSPLKRQEETEDEDDEEDGATKKEKDPFDKLVESPSFFMGKCAGKTIEVFQEKVVKSLMNEPLSLFRELPETMDDYSRDMELSDTESQTQPIFSRGGGGDEIFSDTFTKSSSEQNTLDLEFPKNDDRSMDVETIQASIERVIAQTSFNEDEEEVEEEEEDVEDDDDDSNEALMITPSTSSYQSVRKREAEVTVKVAKIATVVLDLMPPSLVLPEEIKEEPPIAEAETKESVEKSAFAIIKQLPVVQETDKVVVIDPIVCPAILLTVLPKVEDVKESIVKPKIVDSILQKFSTLKSKLEIKSPVREASVEKEDVKTEEEEEEEDEKPELIDPPKESNEPPAEHANVQTGDDDKLADEPEDEDEEENLEVIEIEKAESPPPPPLVPTFVEENDDEPNKRRKMLSRPFMEFTDSSDSEHLVIARLDEDSRSSSSLNKPEDVKESDSNMSATQTPQTDESQSQQEEERRNFKFDIVIEEVKQPDELPVVIETSPVRNVSTSSSSIPPNTEETRIKDEVPPPDLHLHSLLLCEETIPRSPTSATEGCVVDIEPPAPRRSKSALEMPFASAPGSSNNKSMLLGVEQQQQQQPQHKPLKLLPPPLVIPIESPGRDNRNASAVLDNTPPTTPESTLSNLSPREDNDGLSPNTRDNDNESCKSNDVENDYLQRRRGSLNKMSPYSEEDTQMAIDPSKKHRDDPTQAPCRKRRKSCRTSDESPSKRGRKSLNRPRHNSDSDDTSDHSLISTNIGPITYERTARSPRPSKYNFFVEFDPSLDSTQRIAMLQQKLTELRKTYADVKAELATVERRRKKLRRREREALKTTKQELTCV